MGRILVVDPDPDIQGWCKAALAEAGHEVVVTPHAPDASRWATSAGIDVVVFSARLSGKLTPEAFTRVVRKHAAPYPVGFAVMISGRADEELVAELLEDESIFLFRKPPNPRLLRGAVAALLGAVRREQGAFPDGSFGRLLDEVVGSGEAGILTVYRGSLVRKLVLRDGVLVSCSSSDPREWTGHTFVRAGLITEVDLKLAMAKKAQTPAPLGKILEDLGMMKAGAAERALERHFQEMVLDLFLWKEGSWTWHGARGEGSDTLRVDLHPMLVEGKIREVRWTELREQFPSDEARFRVNSRRAEPGFPSTHDDRLLVGMIEAGATLGRMREELRRDFSLFSRLSELASTGAVATGTEVPAPAPEAPTAPVSQDDAHSLIQLLLDDAERALLADDAVEARALYRRVLSASPTDAVARRGLIEVDHSLRDQALDRGLTPERLVFRGARPDRVFLTSDEGFILARLDPEGISIGDLVAVCPISEGELLAILERLIDRDLVTLEGESSGLPALKEPPPDREIDAILARTLGRNTLTPTASPSAPPVETAAPAVAAAPVPVKAPVSAAAPARAAGVAEGELLDALLETEVLGIAPEPADAEPETFASLLSILASIEHGRKSCRVILTRDQETRTLLFSGGILAGIAERPRPDESIPRLARRRGVLLPDAARTYEKALLEGKSEEAAAAAGGVRTKSALAGLRQLQTLERAAATFEWPAGRFRIEPWTDPTEPDGAITPTRIAIQGLRHYIRASSEDLVRVLRPYGDLTLKQMPGAHAELLGLSEEEARLLSIIDGKRTLRFIETVTPASALLTFRLLLGFCRMGIAVITPAPAAREPAESVRARIASLRGRDAFAMLGMSWSASGVDLRAARERAMDELSPHLTAGGARATAAGELRELLDKAWNELSSDAQRHAARKAVVRDELRLRTAASLLDEVARRRRAAGRDPEPFVTRALELRAAH